MSDVYVYLYIAILTWDAAKASQDQFSEHQGVAA
jgi:hypothetical protein